MKSSLLFFALVFSALAASPDKTQIEGHLLDRNEFLCTNCFLGTNAYYYCFEAGDRILIGFQRTPTFNWADATKNRLTALDSAWKPWTPGNETVPLRYDKKHIWVARPNGKTVKLKQDYNTDIFINDSKCRSVVRKPSDY